MRNPLSPLGGTEMEVLRHVWDLGHATVRDVHERIQTDRRIAYTTVMTVIKKLADKGYLTYEQEGTAYVYRAAKEPEEVRGNLLSGFVDKVFGGSPLTLVQALAQQEALSDDEREAVQRILDAMEDSDA